MAFFKKWYVSGLPLIILIAARLFAKFRVLQIEKALDGVISGETDLALIKYAFSLCALCSLLTVIMAAIVVIVIIILMLQKDTPFGVLLAHFFIFALVSAVSYSLTSACENTLQSLGVSSSDPVIEQKYFSYINQFNEGRFFIGEPEGYLSN